MKVSEFFSKDSAEPDLGKIDGFLRKQQQARHSDEVSWRINQAFYEGSQYVYYNRQYNRIDRLGTEEGEKPRYRVRLTCNQILGVVRTYLAKMTKNQPMMEAAPASGQQEDIKAARLGEVVFRYLWDELDLEDKLHEAILYSLLMGQGYWEVYWDDQAGDPMEFVKHPQTGEYVVTDDAEKTVREWAERNGVELEVDVLHQGQVGVEVISPFELFLIGGKTPQEAYAAIKVKGYSRDYVQENWGVDLKATGETEQFFDGKADVEDDHKDSEDDLVVVKQMYTLPNSAQPEGMYLCWANDKVLTKAAFPYDDHKLPFAKFGAIKTPGRRYDMSVISHLIGLQKELNRAISQYIEQKNISYHPPILAPKGSIQKRITSEPGQVIPFLSPNGQKPEALRIPEPGSHIFTHIDGLLQRINDVSGQHEVSHAKVPTGVESGVAIGMLQEQDDTRLAPMIRQMELAITRAGQLMLSRVKQFYLEERLVQIRGSNGISEVKAFKGSDLAGVDDIRVVEGSMIPKSRAAQNQLILDMLDRGVIDFRRAAPLLDIGGAGQLTQEWEQHRKRQERENERMSRGEPAPMIEDFDNDEEHLDVMTSTMTSIDFETYPPEVQEQFRIHFRAHKEKIDNRPPPLPEMKPVSTSIQLRGEATPAERAAALAPTGSPVDVQVIAQQVMQMMQAQAAADAEAYGHKAQTDAIKHEQQSDTDLAKEQIKYAQERAIDIAAPDPSKAKPEPSSNGSA